MRHNKISAETYNAMCSREANN